MTVHAPVFSAEPGYDTDFHAWALAQAALLRTVRPDGVDWENVAEEIEDLGKARSRELFSRLRVIIEHLLKLEHGRNREPAGGWIETLVEQRQELDYILRESPSLRRQIEPMLDRSFGQAWKKALAGFKRYEPAQLAFYEETLPAVLPYTVTQLLDEDFLPEPSGR